MSSIEPNDPLFSEAELKRVLEVWVAPEPSKTLDERVSNSYYRELRGNDAVTRPVALPQSQNEVVTMKFCSTCQEEFADKFSFCPVDGTPLNGFVPKDEESVTRAAAHEPAAPVTTSVTNSPAHAAAAAAGAAGAAAEKEEFHFTFLDDAGLFQRLLTAAKDVAHESELTWPEFKRDPFGFTKRGVVGYSQAGWRAMSQPHVATAVLVALFAVMTLVLGVFLLDRYQMRRDAELAAAAAENELADTLIDIPNETPTPEIPGTAGLNKGTGGGSKPKPERAGGGGGGGRQETKEASFGKTPQASLTVPQVVAPDPKPPVIKNPSLPVAATLVGDPMLIPPDARVLPYGDPKSKSTDLSSGPGTGNGIGTGTGGGIGSGTGGGVGPGRDGNIGGGPRNDGGGGPGGGADYTRTFSPKEVTTKARVLSKPEPQYTEEARKNQITGTVVLRAVFSSAGQVTNIRSVNGLPFGLTERAIAAARQIKFSPAMKDGRPVSMYIQLEYNFNLY